MEKYVYRFRSTDALLEGFRELENQEIYLASPRELNDPLEGFKEVFWTGDEIVWTNLMRHYLLCLMQWVLVALLREPDCAPLEDLPVFQTDDGLPSSIRALFHSLCTDFFSNDAVARLPVVLAARDSRETRVKRNELLSLLWFLHLYALKKTFSAISPETPICSIDATLRGKADVELRLKQVLSAQDMVVQKYGSSGKPVEHLNSQTVSAIHQTIIISAYNDKSKADGAPWNRIWGFPGDYIREIEKLLHFEWCAASFVAQPTHAAMWGNYGDKHRGVCLKFKTELNAAGKPSIVLDAPGRDGPKQVAAGGVHRDPHCELLEVDYRSPHVEIDFFRSMGRMTRQQLAFWFQSSTGTISTTGRDMLQESEEWRREYWRKFDQLQKIKLSDWGHEAEYRVTYHSMIEDLSDKSKRKLRYRFGDLHGIIFGMNTPLDDILAIISVVESKCRKEGRKEFEFSQAYYSPQSHKVELMPLPLLAFRN